MSTSARTAATLVVIGALFAGVVIGIAGDRAWLWHRGQLAPRPGRFLPGRLVERLDRELHFTPQQKATVQQILERRRARIEAISGGIRPQIRQEMEATNAEIEKVLTPEQQVKYRELSSRMRQRHHRGMGPAMGPPPNVR